MAYELPQMYRSSGCLCFRIGRISSFINKKLSNKCHEGFEFLEIRTDSLQLV